VVAVVVSSSSSPLTRPLYIFPILHIFVEIECSKLYEGLFISPSLTLWENPLVSEYPKFCQIVGDGN
jgi:hypothetical protein